MSSASFSSSGNPRPASPDAALVNVVLEAFAALSPERQGELLTRLALVLQNQDAARYRDALCRMLSAETDGGAPGEIATAKNSDAAEEPRTWEDIWAAIQEEGGQFVAVSPMEPRR